MVINLYPLDVAKLLSQKSNIAQMIQELQRYYQLPDDLMDDKIFCNRDKVSLTGIK